MTAKVFYVLGHGYYLYDGLTNRIITIGADWTNNGNGFISEGDLLSRFRDDGIVSDGVWNTFNWRESFDFLKEKYETGLESLVLQVTRDCNLRCSYCAYSGNYRNMLPHSKDEMSEEMICRSIDFFMEHSSKSSKVVILFYGGEPLLKYKHLKMAIQYADKYGRQISYGITSNGVALSPEIVKWLNNHPNVYLTITLNGLKHDDYRRTIDNKGSLQSILDNISYVRNFYPNVWKNQIRFIANIVSAQELPKLREFYSQIIQKPPIMVSYINIDYCDDEIKVLFKSDDMTDDEVVEKLQMEYIQSNDPFLKTLYDEKISMIHNRGICGEKEPVFLNSCMPMSWRLFVRTDGTFNMCEKVSDSISLGNLQDGFNEERIKELYSQMKVFAEHNCRNCWAQRLCMYCYQDVIDENGRLITHFTSDWCARSQQSILRYLKLYVSIANQNPEKLSGL